MEKFVCPGGILVASPLMILRSRVQILSLAPEERGWQKSLKKFVTFKKIFVLWHIKAKFNGGISHVPQRLAE
jgi:hypothetical protein